MDGADADGQGFLQVDEDVRVDAGAGRGALGGRGLVQQLLEAVELDQQHHVLQEVALDESGELRGAKELRSTRGDDGERTPDLIHSYASENKTRSSLALQ